MGQSSRPPSARAQTAGPQSAGPESSRRRSSRTIALVGPYLGGKTTLLDALLERTGALSRPANATGPIVGDASPEARAHGMSVEMTVADTAYLGDRLTFVDCPGSIEFQHQTEAVLRVADAAIVVVEPDPRRLSALQVILHRLDTIGLPFMLFLNKIDTCSTPIRELLPILQPASRRPLVLRQIPIWENGIATGYVDLALERAFIYREHAPSTVIAIPASAREREKDARFHMLERLADYDDALMEQLLADIEPPRDLVFDDLARELADGRICPVLLGSAQNGNGIVRLLKAIRHEVPDVGQAVARRGLADVDGPIVQVIRTTYTPHGGKLSVARVLKGTIEDGTELTGPRGDERVSGVFSLFGNETTKRQRAEAGDTVALGRLERVMHGDCLALGGRPLPADGTRPPPAPVYCIAIGIADRKDEVKLSSALHRLLEEDPSLALEQKSDTHQLLLKGQGEMHVRVALERLERKYGIVARRFKRLVAYKETIRKSTKVRGRHKKQSGGHGQFGDCVIEIAPEVRGAGFRFAERIVGGAIPRQYLPSVEIGVQEAMKAGPLGFPVVDVTVTIVDGSYHSVDSSDMAFRQAGRIAMADGLPACQPVLLEPVMRVEITTPSDGTARVNAMIPQRRGQILGIEPCDGASGGIVGWDRIEALIPDAEMDDLIIELRSATSGVGTFRATHDHLSELAGKLAEQVLTSHAVAAE